VVIYFLVEINNLSRLERVPRLLQHRVGICSDVEGAAVAMAIGGVEADLGEHTMAAGDMSRRGG
jgi:hypothetical protein